MAQYSFSYSSQRRFRKRVFLVFLCICALFLASRFVQNFLFFSAYSVVTREDTKRVEMYFVTPLASPIAQSDTVIPLITPMFHSVKLQRGNMVYLSAQNEKSHSFFPSFFDGLVNFITFNQFAPLSLTSVTAEKPAIRRLLALPGDTVYMKDFILYVKPAGEQHFLTEFELTSKQYDIYLNELPANWDIDLGSNGQFDPFLLRTDEYFVVSDNRTESVDSRLWGPVRADRIAGRVFFRFFPFSDVSLL